MEELECSGSRWEDCDVLLALEDVNRCPGCHRNFCDEHFNHEQQMCWQCWDDVPEEE